VDQEVDMERATSARNELGPLLDLLISQLDAEGSATQRRYFARIRRCLEQAGHEAELATSIRELYCTSAVGFSFSSDATPLIDRILEKAERLARDLEGEYQPRH
jgi:hypothetical protein